MNIRIECPSCKQKYSVYESLIGEEVECSFCNHVFVAQKKPPIKLELPKNTSSYSAQSKQNNVPTDVSTLIVPTPQPENNSDGIKSTEITEQEQYSNTANKSNTLKETIIEEEELLSECEMAGPWRRWAARFVDLTFEAFICSIILYSIFYLFYAPNSKNTRYFSSSDPIDAIVSWLINYILAPASSFFLDSAIYGIFKGTFGKWLFGVKVIEKAGERPIASRYFSRNLGVLCDGLGMSIPLINLFAAISQFKLVSKGEPTTYDKRLGFQSIKYNNRIIKTIVGIVLVAIIIILNIFSRIQNS